METSQQLGISLQGRLRNTNLPQSKSLFPIFEAVVNSIYAIDDRLLVDKSFSMADASIRVIIERESSADLFGGKSAISSITIEDNGIGFNDANYESFKELDSLYRQERGCKGVGRLLWLKAFSLVEVDSTYQDKSSFARRHFIFSSHGLNERDNVLEEGSKICTRVKLCNLNKEFSEVYSKQSQESVARCIFEHCLWFFLRKGSCPDIRVIDGEDVATNLNEIYEAYMCDETKSDSFKVNDEEFDILHVKLHKSVSNNHISYCAGNRIVFDEKIKDIVGLYDSAIDSSTGKFYYNCFVTSKFLDEKVAPDRFSFLIPKKKEDESLNEIVNEIYWSDIQSQVLNKIRTYLEPYLQDNIAAGRELLSNYVDKKAPFYKAIFSNLPIEEQSVNPGSNEKAMDLYLYGKMVEKEQQLIEDGHNVLQVRTGESDDEYSDRIKRYVENIQQLKQTDLARYVIHRKHILELLKEALKIGEDGKYSKEERIHDLIMPMQKTSGEIHFKDNNLWIIDERLVFHHYLSSDLSFKSMETKDSDSLSRPDILIENIFDNPMLVTEKDTPPFATIRIVEFKRPMRNDMVPDDNEKDPILQCYNYILKIKEGGTKTKDGRPINIAKEIPAYCYIICDLTPKMIQVCEAHDFKKTYDGLGYFGYKSNVNMYYEIISLDQLLNSANERNIAFFDCLGLPHD